MLDNSKIFEAPSYPPAAAPVVGRRRVDSGWWLLRGASARTHEWARLQSVHQIADPVEPRSAFVYAAAKRALDVIAAIFLLLILAPLLLVIAAAVAFDSRGSVIFRQSRVGKDGRRFVIWKFRSMRADAAMYARSPISGSDERLTRVGCCIRRLSLDELPQLVNVLRGEMSLVGPRPEMPFIADRYNATERLRLSVKPGITGLWQISHGRASAIHENLQFDLHYIREQNLLLDAAILLRTLSVVVQGTDAV